MSDYQKPPHSSEPIPPPPLPANPQWQYIPPKDYGRTMSMDFFAWGEMATIHLRLNPTKGRK